MDKIPAIWKLIFSNEWVVVTDDCMYGSRKRIAFSPYIHKVLEGAVKFGDENEKFIKVKRDDHA